VPQSTLLSELALYLELANQGETIQEIYERARPFVYPQPLQEEPSDSPVEDDDEE